MRTANPHLPPTAGRVLANFCWMSLCFSLNHGCVTSCLALASAQLGPALGGYSSAILYLFYTTTALLVAPAIVRTLGPKGSLDYGLLLYCVYVGSYALAILLPAYRWPAVVVGAALGGLAAGWLWTAQGGYFAAAAELYAHVLQLETEVTTSFLSGIFATLYLGFELGLKLVSSFVLSRARDASGSESARDDASRAASLQLFAIYTAVAVLSAIGMFFVAKMPPHPRDGACGAAADSPPAADEREDGCSPAPATRADDGAAPPSSKLLLAVNLMRTDAKIWLLAPINASFGFMASLMNFYVNGVLVNTTLGVRTCAAVPCASRAAHCGTRACESAAHVSHPPPFPPPTPSFYTCFPLSRPGCNWVAHVAHLRSGDCRVAPTLVARGARGQVGRHPARRECLPTRGARAPRVHARAARPVERARAAVHGARAWPRGLGGPQSRAHRRHVFNQSRGRICKHDHAERDCEHDWLLCVPVDEPSGDGGRVRRQPRALHRGLPRRRRAARARARDGEARVP